MATKISLLPAASALAGTEPFPVVQSAATKQSDIAAIATYLRGVAHTWAQTQNFANIVIGSANSLAWSTDLFLHRDAADTLAQRNGTTAQALRVYGTYTDGTNYERIAIQSVSNVFRLGPEHSGSGVGRLFYVGTLSAGGGEMHFLTAGSGRFKITTAGHFVANIDNTYDIGASGATRPRDAHIARNLILGGQTVNLASGAQGDILIRNATEWARLAPGTSGQYLKTLGAGADPVWDTPAGGGGSPGGSDTQVQFNDAGAFGGDAGLTYNKTTDVLSVSGTGGYAIGSFGSLKASSDGVFVLTNNAGGSIGRLNFGAVASTSVALKKGVGATQVQVRLGDDSGYGSIYASFYARQAFTVATLPSAATAGDGAVAYVTDATATTAGSIVAGGGSNKVLVISNGTDWLIAGGTSAGGSPGGSNTQVQFNDGGAFGGDAGLTYNKTTDTLSTGDIVSVGANGVNAAAAAAFYWTSRSIISSPSDGVIRLTNAAVSSFSRLQFGGTTSSFPALKRSTTQLQARLADDSDDASISSSYSKLKAYTVAALPSAATAGQGSTAFVTDATATTPRSTVAGGGSNKVLVMSDGTNWLIVA